MKFVLQLVAFFLLFGIIYIVILNGNDSITLQLWAPRYDTISQTVYHTTKTLNLAFFILGILGAGLFVGVCVKVLQAKIEVLEKALKEALNNKY